MSILYSNAMDRNDMRKGPHILRVTLASLYLSIIVLLPFLHNHPLEVGQPEPADCPAHAFIVTGNAVVNNAVTIVIVFFSFIYLIPVKLFMAKYVVPNHVKERAPPAFGR